MPEAAPAPYNRHPRYLPWAVSRKDESSGGDRRDVSYRLYFWGDMGRRIGGDGRPGGRRSRSSSRRSSGRGGDPWVLGPPDFGGRCPPESREPSGGVVESRRWGVP